MSLLGQLRAICGAGHARPATADDDLLGRAPHWVVWPRTTEETAEVVKLAVRHQARTVMRGGRGKLHWGPAPRPIDLVIDTSRMVGVVRHDPDAGVATVAAGSRLDVLGKGFEPAGQRLPLDPPGPATVGGTVATATAGPLRMRYGDAPHLMRALTLVCGDGSVRRIEPGQPLAAAVHGGFGTLGVITEVTFRLHPLPPVRRWVVRTVASPVEVRDLTVALLSDDSVLSAIEVHNPYGPGEGRDQIGVLVEGSADEVAAAVQRLGVLLRGGGLQVRTTPPMWWYDYPFHGDDIALRITTSPTEIYSAGYIVRDGAGETPVRTRWSPGVATMYAALPGDTDPNRVVRLLEDVRQTRRGNCVVLHAPPAVRRAIDMWGLVPRTDALRRIKRDCDPYGLFAPGRHPTDRARLS